MQDNIEGTDYTCTVCGYRTAIDDANAGGNIIEHFCRRCTQMQSIVFELVDEIVDKAQGNQHPNG